MDPLHSSANSNVLKGAASPEVLEAALEAAERLEQDAAHGPDAQPEPKGDVGHSASQDEGGAAGAEPPPHADAQTPAPGALQAATALAEGGRDAMRAWLAFAQDTTRANVEALGRFAECRTWSEVMSVQSDVLQQGLRQSLDFGEAVSRASTEAAWKAADALQASASPEPRPPA